MRNTNPLVFGNDRYTVLCAECVRIEHSEQGVFVDEPSLFAINRTPSFKDFKTRLEDGALVIETTRFKLTRKPGGRPSWQNLNVEVVGAPLPWHPGKNETRNLGGTLATLDGVDKARPLEPGLLSRDGWHCVDDSKTHLLRDGWAANRPEGAGSDWYLFAYGSDYKAALKALATVAGQAPMPRKAILGSWYSRWWSYSSDDYRDIVAEYEKNGFPLDILVMDMDWHRKDDAVDGTGWAGTKGWTGWSWNRKLLPDAEHLLKELKDKKLSVTLNVHPHDGVRRHEDMYQAFMEELGEDMDRGDYLLFDAGNKQYMDAFFKHTHAVHEDAGVDFWWLDWQQDSIYPHVKGFPGLTHLRWLNVLYHQHTSRGGKRGLSFSRWAGWGDHRHPIHFSGDAHACWDMLAFEVPFTAAAGNVGCFFWSHDMGGFHGPRDEELYARWLQFGATTAAMRCHSCGDELDRRPWKWGREHMESMRKSFNLRATLMPYIYSAVHESCAETLPLNRPMYLQHPRDEAAYRNPQQYYFGSSLLAAPVASRGEGPDKVAFQSVWLPEGAWFNLLTGERFDGPCERLVPATLDETPLFVKGGTPIPLCAPTLRMTSNIPAALTIAIYPSKTPGTFTLYEDDGLSADYKKGRRAETALSYERIGSTHKIVCAGAKGSFAGLPKQRAYAVEMRGVEAPRKVLVDGVKTAFDYDSERQVCRVAVGELPIAKGFAVAIDAAESAPAIAAVREFNRRAGGEFQAEDVAALAQSKPALCLRLLRLAGLGPVFKNEALNLNGNQTRLKFHFQSDVPGFALDTVSAVYQRRGGNVWKDIQTVTLATTGEPVELPPFNDGEFGAPLDFAKPSRLLLKFKLGGADITLPFAL